MRLFRRLILRATVLRGKTPAGAGHGLANTFFSRLVIGHGLNSILSKIVSSVWRRPAYIRAEARRQAPAKGTFSPPPGDPLSFVGKIRLTLFRKRRHAFFLILGGERRVKQPAFKSNPFGKRWVTVTVARP